MDREELQSRLISAHEQFINYVNSLSDEQFEYRHDGIKWNAGQEMLHIIKSVKAVSTALSLPKFALRMRFGTSNRPTRSYEQVTTKYLAVLSAGNIRTAPSFEPEMVTASDRESLIEKLRDKVAGLSKALDRYSEQDLDKLILPHPLLGKMPLREMGYFTIFHVGHHQNNNRKNLAKIS